MAIPAKYRHRAVLAPSEIAEVAPVSRATVYRMIRAGEMPARQLGGRHVVPAEWVWRWLGISEGAEVLERDPELRDLLTQFRAEVG